MYNWDELTLKTSWPCILTGPRGPPGPNRGDMNGWNRQTNTSTSVCRPPAPRHTSQATSTTPINAAYKTYNISEKCMHHHARYGVNTRHVKSGTGTDRWGDRVWCKPAVASQASYSRAEITGVAILARTLLVVSSTRRLETDTSYRVGNILSDVTDCVRHNEDLWTDLRKT